MSTASPAAELEIVYDGVILGRAGKYDGYPAHLHDSGTHSIWWCSQGTYDEIWRATKTGSLGPGNWSAPQKAFGTSQSLWSVRHTCDPSVIKGSFQYEGRQYALALYYTAWNDSQGTNAIGVAFSNDGLTWRPHPAPVVLRQGNTPGYGAGMSGVAFQPGTGKLLHAYLDSTLVPILRLNETTDGLHFSPVPASATQLAQAGRQGDDGQGPDIAYNPADGHWYAAIKNHDPAGIYDGETRVLRSAHPDILGPWEVIGLFNSSNTGWQQNHNPGLGKNGNGSLYIDSLGWGYVFFTVGNPRPDTSTWDIAQGRFRPSAPPLDFYTLRPCRLIDTRSTAPFTAADSRKTIQVAGNCGVPSTAKALSVNLTVVGATGQVEFSLFPGDLSGASGRQVQGTALRPALASNAVLRLSADGTGTLGAEAHFSGGGQADLIVDVNGYFQ